MSVDAPARPTAVLPDVDVDLADEVNSAVPCNAEEIIGAVDHCPNQAAWILIWRETCVCGGRIPFDIHGLFCDGHCDLIKRGSYPCPSCWCRDVTPEHIVQRIDKL